MDIKVGSKIHNRFEIEVRNKDTGELKQKGQAENIILDRMYTRLCNFSTYFSHIHFGEGTGTLDPSRTKLFKVLGSKSATNEEMIQATPISRLTRKIILNPEEYVGKIITEVGISDNTTDINTHALIRDAEGNLLNIEKTDTDVIIIYATVFIELKNKSTDIYFTNFPNNNALVNYFFGGYMSAPKIQAGIGIYKAEALSIGIETISKAPSVQVDLANRKRLFSTRLGITEGNQALSEIGLESIFRCRLYNSSLFGKYTRENVTLGAGDGVKTSFYIKDHSIENLEIKIEGYKTTAYSSNEEWVIGGESSYFSKERMLICSYNYANGVSLTSTGNYVICTDRISGVMVFSLVDTGWPILLRKLSQGGGELVSNTGDYLKVGNLYFKLEPRKAVPITDENLPVDIQWTTFKERPGIKLHSVTTSIWGDYLVYLDRVVAPTKKITFNTPPPEGAIITADYTVPYIPKTEDYVLDITLEIQFGEGV